MAIVTAATSVTFLKAIQECSDMLPPLKLVVTIVVIIVEKIQVQSVLQSVALTDQIIRLLVDQDLSRTMETLWPSHSAAGRNDRQAIGSRGELRRSRTDSSFDCVI
jgi:hypothetical protein